MVKGMIARSAAAALGAALVQGIKRKRSNGKSTAAKRMRSAKTGQFVATRRKTYSKVGRKYRKDSSTAHRELTKFSTVMGRPLKKNLSNLWRVQKKIKLIQGVQAVSNFGGISGSLTFDINQSAAGQVLTCGNIRLLSVTATGNVNKGVQTNPTAMWYLQFTNEADTAQSAWVPQGQLGLLEGQNPANYSDTYPLTESMLSWVNLKLMLYNALNSPGKYMIELVELTDRRLQPETENINSEDIRFAAAFWQAQAKPYLHNPIAIYDTSYEKYKKVHKKLFIEMDSKDTDQTTSTNYKEVNFFARLNRKCVYNFQHDDRMPLFGQEAQVNAGDNENQVHYSKRLYILIRALVTRPGYPISYNANLMPSFDFTFRTCHVVNS